MATLARTLWIGAWPLSAGNLEPRSLLDAIYDDPSGWPQRCSGLEQQLGQEAYSARECGGLCRLDPMCSAWQLTDRDQCWISKSGHCGADCLGRGSNEPNALAPKGGQCIQHGSVRVLNTLRSFWVYGLYNVGITGSSTGPLAHERCRLQCYSDIGCRYWQYGENGCWLERAPDHVVPAKPDVSNSSDEAMTMVKGEVVEHVCTDRHSEAQSLSGHVGLLPTPGSWPQDDGGHPKTCPIVHVFYDVANGWPGRRVKAEGSNNSVLLDLALGKIVSEDEAKTAAAKKVEAAAKAAAQKANDEVAKAKAEAEALEKKVAKAKDNAPDPGLFGFLFGPPIPGENKMAAAKAAAKTLETAAAKASGPVEKAHAEVTKLEAKELEDVKAAMAQAKGMGTISIVFLHTLAVTLCLSGALLLFAYCKRGSGLAPSCVLRTLPGAVRMYTPLRTPGLARMVRSDRARVGDSTGAASACQCWWAPATARDAAAAATRTQRETTSRTARLQVECSGEPSPWRGRGSASSARQGAGCSPNPAFGISTWAYAPLTPDAWTSSRGACLSMAGCRYAPTPPWHPPSTPMAPRGPGPRTRIGPLPWRGTAGG